jgi:hypothetical protein
VSHPRDQFALERGRRFLFVASVLAVGVGAWHAYDAVQKFQSPWPVIALMPVLLGLLWGWHAFLTRRQPTGALPTAEQVRARGGRAARRLHWISLVVGLAALALTYLAAQLR